MVGAMSMFRTRSISSRPHTAGPAAKKIALISLSRGS
jgi:hypothetical protein